MVGEEVHLQSEDIQLPFYLRLALINKYKGKAVLHMSLNTTK